MNYKYTIPDVPPSNNEFIGRSNIWDYREAKADWEKRVFYCCTPKPREPLQNVIVKITYYFKTKGRRDPDNYSGKMILDGLVKARIIADDCFGNIQLVLCGEYDKVKPRTVVEVESK